ncbi:aromatic ring-hydroxylating oxygenase subunit alpha [Nocardia violaceofusca]|uniref:aromatic ring-hydroxylating oxygenase subunit alpha n=1 Tax=Nocardia violaceofusca TaxID=941182 RepID=UPI000A05D0E3|nr:aromatic ring-hydroxylating dioxygenase subunit alpha [Nocardia violaceofusca]
MSEAVVRAVPPPNGESPAAPPNPFAGLQDVVSVRDKLTQEYHDAVLEEVFRPSWFLVGNVNDVPKAGSYFVLDVPTFNTSVLVQRGRDGEVRAFHNVCRHRGKKVIPTACGFAEGASPAHTCWFHGWSYTSEGTLRSVPDEEQFRSLDKSRLGLVPIRVEVRSGLIYVHFGDNPEPLAEWLGEVAEGFDGYYNEMEKISCFSIDVRANWNIAMDSFSEGYHTVFLHRRTQPKLAGKSNPMRHKPVIDMYRRHIRTSNPANPDYVSPPVEGALYGLGRKLTPAVETDFSMLPPGVNRTRHSPWFFDIVWQFPNVAILNGSHWYTVVTVWPIDPSHTRIIFDSYARKARHAGDRLAQAYTRALQYTVSREDLAAMEDVQRGLESGAIDDVYLSMQEFALQHRYGLVNELIGDR